MEEFPASRSVKKKTVSPICQARPSLSEPAHSSRSRGRLIARFGAKKGTGDRVERPTNGLEVRCSTLRALDGP